MSGIRRGAEVLLLFFLIVFTYAATNWHAWAVLTIFFAVLLIVDFMFLNDGFMFDPFYTSWSKLNDPNY